MEKKVLSRVFAVMIIFSMLIANVPTASAKEVIPGLVYAKGTQFVVDGFPFYYAGCNSYDLFTRSAAEIDQRMSDMASDGVKVLRTWGFSHEEWHGFEPAKGQYSEEEFKLFDYIMKSAQDNGIKVIITLENYWEAYGGIDARLEWEGLPSGDHASRSKFYTDAGCKQGYRDYLEHFVNRVNTYTDVPYKEDPTVFAWELMNEPRYQDAGENSTGLTLRAWVDEMAGYIKELDPNHMVAAGIEGHEAKYGFGGDEGNPFISLQQSPSIDFCTAHPYPDEKWANLTPEQSGNLVRAWIKDAHEEVGKPFVLEEFNTHDSKEEYWNEMIGALEELDAAGTNFWNYHSLKTSNFDILHGDSILTTIFKPHSVRMEAKNKYPVHIPDTFTQNTPASGMTGLLTRPVFEWDRSLGAQTYDLVISTKSDFSNPVVSVTGITATQYVPDEELEFGTTYYWKVSAVNSLGSTDASNTGIKFSIRTKPTTLPGSFTLSYPGGNDTAIIQKPVFKWTPAKDALNYNLVVSKNSSFTSPVIDVKGLTVCEYTPTEALSLDTTYYWKVTVVNNIGNVNASNSGSSFATVDIPPVNAKVSVEAYLSSMKNNESQMYFKVSNSGPESVDKFSLRLYFNLSEVYAAGYTANNIIFEKFFGTANEKVTVTGPFTWDEDNNIYYYQLNWNDYVLANGASVEQSIRVRTDNWQDCWDGTNDYCTNGLTDTLAQTQNMPLYRGVTKMWGKNPGQAVSTATPTPKENKIYGDVNGDGKVDSGDYTLVRKYLLGIITAFPAENGLESADVNADGKVDSGDYTILRKFLLKQISTLPY